jgi:hypothetical protein
MVKSGMSWIRTSMTAFCFLCGLYFAILQFSYFFLMEAYLSSQYLSYFISLFFWLCGFLTGLLFARARWFGPLLVTGTLAYYLAWTLTRIIPFHPQLYIAAAACSIVSGLGPGCFFPAMAERFPSIKGLLFHENNGFFGGILVALKASIYCGSWFLAYGPLLGAVAVAALFSVQPRSLSSPPDFGAERA